MSRKPKLYSCVTAGCYEAVSSARGPAARCAAHKGSLLPKKPTWKPKRQGIGVELRRHVLQRDGYRCTHCGIDHVDPDSWLRNQRTWHIDHVIPSSLLGPTKAWNLVTSCGRCNLSRQHRGFDLVLLAQTHQKEAATA